MAVRILTVEDDERIRTAVSLALEEEGWEVEEAANGEAALVAFAQNPSDVVLIDIMLPGIDVDELSDVMKAHERVADIHHMHVWSVDSTMVALSAHVQVNADSLHDAQLVATDIERRLALHGVAHATLALECHPCEATHRAPE